jgi:hypothetical protein
MERSSLDLIQPSCTTGEKPHVHATSETYSKAAAELIYRSTRFVDALNSREFRKFIQMVGPEHISGNFTAYLDNQALAFTWPEFVSTLHEAAKVDPDYRVGIIDQSVDLDDVAGHAVVFMFIEVTGRPTTIKREDALIFEWQRQGGVWKCYGHTAIRGSSAIPLKQDG